MNLIVACDEAGGIGKNGNIPWNISTDMRRFKELTQNSVVIMGRVTWESLPSSKRPLPNRKNIIITSRIYRQAPCDVHFVPSFDEAMTIVNELYNNMPVFVIGGSKVYNEALDKGKIKTIYLTLVKNTYECDAFFPLSHILKTFTVNEKQTDSSSSCTFMKFVQSTLHLPTLS